MGSLIIEGKGSIRGEITVSGNKNAALPAIAAALLTDEKVILENLPDILDVRSMLEIAEMLGAEVSVAGNRAEICASNLKSSEIDRQWCAKNRTSILFAAPLINRCGRAKLYPPGGDIIGRRRLDGHFYGLIQLGVQLKSDYAYSFQAPTRLQGRELFLDEASVTATEQILMAAVLAKGVTTLYNAAAEPHVCDLCDMLNSMGGKISGIGSNTLIIEGVERLHGTTYSIKGDHIEAGSFLSLAAACGGEITIRGIVPRHFWMTRRIFERLGINMDIGNNYIFLPGGQIPEVKRDFDGQIPIIADGPWPQFASDMMSCMIVTATQARGTVLFFEKMFESRIYFVDRLISMGANAIVCDPHRVVISGPSHLRGQSLASPDIRAGMALVIAAMCADGISTINCSEIIYRGYENLVDKLLSIGGKIKEE